MKFKEIVILAKAGTPICVRAKKVGIGQDAKWGSRLRGNDVLLNLF